MTFRRDNFYGWNFDWFSTDRDGNIGFFAAGDGSIPSVVFADEGAYEKVLEYFERLGEITGFRLSEMAERLTQSKTANYAYYFPQASKGLYVYEHDDRTTAYELILLPERGVNIDELPEYVQNFVRPLTFSNWVFEETPTLDLKEYFECD